MRAGISLERPSMLLCCVLCCATAALAGPTAAPTATATATVFSGYTVAPTRVALADAVAAAVGAARPDVVVLRFNASTGFAAFHFAGPEAAVHVKTVRAMNAAQVQSRLLVTGLTSAQESVPAPPPVPPPADEEEEEEEAIGYTFASGAFIVGVAAALGVLSFFVIRRWRRSQAQAAALRDAEEPLVPPGGAGGCGTRPRDGSSLIVFHLPSGERGAAESDDDSLRSYDIVGYFEGLDDAAASAKRAALSAASAAAADVEAADDGAALADPGDDADRVATAADAEIVVEGPPGTGASGGADATAVAVPEEAPLASAGDEVRRDASVEQQLEMAAAAPKAVRLAGQPPAATLAAAAAHDEELLGSPAAALAAPGAASATDLTPAADDDDDLLGRPPTDRDASAAPAGFNEDLPPPAADASLL
jgi:hypothetical protein